VRPGKKKEAKCEGIMLVALLKTSRKSGNIRSVAWNEINETVAFRKQEAAM
jgi:hypothetical protein